MAKLKDKVQNALDEARLLILGAQVLLGFQYRAVFEPGFEKLPGYTQQLKLGALTLLLLTLALLIWPGAYHRIVAGGEDTQGVHLFTTRVMEVALLPFAIALGIDLFAAGERIAGTWAGIVAGVLTLGVALALWYGLEVIEKQRHKERHRGQSVKTEKKSRGPHRTRLKDRIKHVLTETRVVLPGAQALLGFQLVTILTDGFDNLPATSKNIHFISLCAIAASIALLMTPAAYHRIVERGDESEHFHRFSSRILLAAMPPLAIGMCGDFFVVARKVSASTEFAVVVSAMMLALFLGLWFGLTTVWRNSEDRHGEGAAGRDEGQPAAG